MDVENVVSNVVADRLTFSNPSDSDIVPDEIQHRLIYWRDRFKQGQFEIGDIAAEVVARSAMLGFPVTQDRLFGAIGTFCGKSTRTIRYYYETAVFYSPDVRDEFHELPFTHFVFARSLGARWREVLEYAAQYPAMSEAALRTAFTPEIVAQEPPKVETQSSSWVCVGGGPQVVVRYSDVHIAPVTSPRHHLASALSDTSDAIMKLERVIARMGEGEEIEKVRQALSVIRGCLPAIIRSAIGLDKRA